MDTRFWGPDGWKLLHSIAYNYPSHPSKNMKRIYKSFFTTLPYILPCIHCRNSLAQYYSELPIDTFLDSNKDLFRWLYMIHNKVNLKLRNQRINKKSDPSLQSARKFYKTFVYTVNENNCINMPGLNFIYSIVFNYPQNKEGFENIRYRKHRIFFKLLDNVIPFNKFKKIYKQLIENSKLDIILTKRSLLKKWFYGIDRSIKEKIDIDCYSYKEKCKIIENYRAGCKKKTCRKKV